MFCRVLPRKVDYNNLLHVDIQPPATELIFDRDVNTGNLVDYREVRRSEHQATAKESLALTRKPNAFNADVKGNPTNLPFKPPSLSKPVDEDAEDGKPEPIPEATLTSRNIEIDKLLTTPPGMTSGLVGVEPVADDIREILTNDQDELLMKYINDQDISYGIRAANKGLVDKLTREEQDVELIVDNDANELDRQLDDVIKISQVKDKSEAMSSEWVEKLDVNEQLPSFAELFPDPAFTYAFELDTFQKQAIQCLERHDNVFVAAHTSAGKTVVAEYAIAMSIRRNVTRVIYTSPIKALSNQKFRDFQRTFGVDDVGILTGDVQIHADAPCLIMTTEILLQMLYNGSDVIRDLEWVIFDEVHYCNDPERGHVWEEVFIMLPEHVSLVLLSATVNNVETYADWLGRTRNKKTFVIATTKRPVPLEHFIYTGKGSKGKDEMFLFIDQYGKFNKLGYEKAMDARKETETRRDQKYGRKALGWQAEKNFFINVVRYLDANDKLPVILFTLNRKRCDQNSWSLAESMDLTTAAEKVLLCSFRRTLTWLSLTGNNTQIHQEVADEAEASRQNYPSSCQSHGHAQERIRRPPLGHPAHSEGDHRNSLSRRASTRVVRYGDVCHGREHACALSGVRLDRQTW